MRNHIRPWCARVRFAGKNPFLFDGQVFAESDEQARLLLEERLRDTFPSNPNIEAVIPGALVFVPSEE